MDETEINGATYKSGKLDTRTAFHVARRLAPILAKLPATQANPNAGLTEILSPMADALASMSDADADYVIGSCLGVCQRKEGARWAPIWNKTANALQYEDIDLPSMMQLVMGVLQEQLGPFFGSLPGTGTQSPPASPQAAHG
jgi:hypothetical protein